MYKSILAIFFSCVFVAMIAAPTVLTLMDKKDYDISFLLDNSEEEEGKESLKDNDIKILHTVEEDTNEVVVSTSSILQFYSNFYSSTYTELKSPPPERTYC